MSLKKLLTSLNVPERHPSKLTYDELVNAESAYGRTIFGPVPAGHQREFFEHRKNVWIWYESWIDQNGLPLNQTIRYEVRPAGVYKKIAGQGYQKLDGKELDNFRTAAKTYLRLVKTNLYN
ncbi:hypothetical protein IKW73_00645 [Candidatus Saccharibacteria bacterium]|nr:hypothetical protein [Candidatus Saccharibacteria bacterium]